MKDRIKKVRRDAGLSQVEFAKRINVGASTLAMFETGDRLPRDIHIAAICSTFGISEHWLRTGEGEMKAEAAQDPVDELARIYNLDAIEAAAVRAFVSLPENLRDAALEAISAIVREMDIVSSKSSALGGDVAEMVAEIPQSNRLPDSADRPASK